MAETNCYRCGEEIEPDFDICWNCGTALRGTPTAEKLVEVVPEVVPPAAPKQFHLRHLFLWTTVFAVLSGMATSAFGPYVAAWVSIVGMWMTAGLFLALFLIALVYLATSRWSPLRNGLITGTIIDCVRDNDDPRPDEGVPFDLWHQRQQLAQQQDAASDNH